MKKIIYAVLFAICMTIGLLPVSAAPSPQVRWGIANTNSTVTWTGSGDFSDAVVAANQSDKDFYIQLQSDLECIYQVFKPIQNVTIDLNGKTLGGIPPEYDPGDQRNVFIYHAGPGMLAFTDSSSEGQGRLTSYYSLATIGIYGDADLIIDGCTIENTCPGSKNFGQVAIHRERGAGKITVKNSARVLS